MSTVEFKIANEIGTAWYDLPVAFCVQSENKHIADIADEIAQAIADKRAFCVRWNYKGIGQGHYRLPANS